ERLRDERLQSLRQEQLRTELAECSFRPALQTRRPASALTPAAFSKVATGSMADLACCRRWSRHLATPSGPESSSGPPAAQSE
ncbi:unnamed protein product, partial [Polarella glacialis]